MNKKGFTLIELMITLALFSLFAGFLYNAFFTQIKENNSFNTNIDLKYNGDKTMNLITDKLRSNVIESGEGNITQIEGSTEGNILIDLTGEAGLSELKLTLENTFVDNSNSSPVVLCEGITSINMKFGNEDEKDLIFITIYLKSRNDEYTVTSAVNINE